MEGGGKDVVVDLWWGVVARWLRWRQPWMKGRWRCSGEMVVMSDLWWQLLTGARRKNPRVKKGAPKNIYRYTHATTPSPLRLSLLRDFLYNVFISVIRHHDHLTTTSPPPFHPWLPPPQPPRHHTPPQIHHHVFTSSLHRGSAVVPPPRLHLTTGSFPPSPQPPRHLLTATTIPPSHCHRKGAFGSAVN
nr:hypothetical protein [Tanacetum cinerariifolium]